MKIRIKHRESEIEIDEESKESTIKFSCNEIKQIKQFLYSEICERRDYSASKMCEEVLKFIEQMSNNKQSSVIKLLRLKEQLDSNPWQYNWIIEEIDEIIDALNNEEYDDHEQQ